MSSSETLVEKEISEPMSETNKPIDSDPVQEAKQNPSPIKGSDEKKDEIVDTQLEELEKADEIDSKFGENVDENTVVEEENGGEKIEAQEKKDLAFEGEDEKGEDSDEKIEEKDVKIEPQIEKGEEMERSSSIDGVEKGENLVAKIEPQIEKGEEIEKSSLIDGDEKGENLVAKIENDVEIESEKAQKEEEIEASNEEEVGGFEGSEVPNPSPKIEESDETEGIEVPNPNPKKEEDAEIEGSEVPNPNPKIEEDAEIAGSEVSNSNPKTEEVDESKGSEVQNPNPELEESDEIKGSEVPNPNPKMEEIDESEGNEVPNPIPKTEEDGEFEESEVPNPNPKTEEDGQFEESEVPNPNPNVEEVKPEIVDTVPVIGAADNGFSKDEVLEGISENKETKEIESDANSNKIKGETEKEEGISENKETKEVEPDANGTKTKGETENLEGEEGIFVNNEIIKGGNETLENEESENDEIEKIDTKQARVAILESTKEAKDIIKEIEEIDGQIVTDSDEEREVYTEDEEEEEERENDDDDEERESLEREIFDSDALAALLKAATGSDGNIILNSQNSTGTGSRVFNFERPAGLGSSVPVLRPAVPRRPNPNPNNSQTLTVPAETQEEDMSEEEKTLHEKVEKIRVKFLRLVYRSGHNPDDTIAAQVLYRLSLAEGLRRGRTGTNRYTGTEASRRKAIELEGTNADLDFSCNILILGKTGVGKSATINSIFGTEMTDTSAFSTGTKSVREITGMVDGVKFRVLDTPGLKTSIMDQNLNKKILTSVKKYMQKCPPDIVLYIDRMDTQTRDLNDLPLLKTITNVLGSSIWFNAIVCLTHAGSAPPEGPNGNILTYEVFVAQRSHVVQQIIRQAAGDMRLMNPVSLIENHNLCRKNTSGNKVLPNGLAWRQQLLLLCYSSKILSEANGLLKLQDNNNNNVNKLFGGFRFRSPPLPFLLSSLLQSRAHPKLENGDNNGDSDLELDDFEDLLEEDLEDEYDNLPFFKPLKKAQIEKLTKEQKRAYFEEYEYRVKLLQKKQWREEVKRMTNMKREKGNNTGTGFGTSTGTEQNEDFDEDNSPASVPVPLPDMALPLSFDSDGPNYRYRFLEPSNGLLTRPVLDTHGWDHDVGYDGVSLEETLTLINKFPANATVQITKDKKEFSIHLESSLSAKHGDNGSSLLGFDIQTIGRQLGYILRGETKFKTLKRNKTTGGLTLTFLGDIVATGAKLEDQIGLGKRVTLVASTGLVKAQGDTAYGANLEARLKDKDYPIGQSLTTLGLSLMRWRGDLAIGANLQSQIPIGFGSKVALRVGLNNKLSGQISVRTSTSESVQIAVLGVVPVLMSLVRTYFGGNNGGEGFAY